MVKNVIQIEGITKEEFLEALKQNSESTIHSVLQKRTEDQFKDPEELFSTEEAAKKMGLTTHTLRKYLRESLVPGIKSGKNWKISLETINNYKTQNSNA